MTLYKIQVNKAQIKIISKALDVLKSISKGEISRASSVISENKITQVKHTGELEEIFDQRIRQLKLSLIDIENIYFSKYLTILKLGEFGLKLLHIKKKLIDSGFILNKNNEIMLQQRAHHKYHSPLLWTNTCCSHQRVGETNIEAGTRRLREEMGFEADLKELFHFIYKAPFDNGLTEHELDHVMIGNFNGTPKINTDEVASYKWMTLEEVKKDIELQPKLYTAWFKIIFKESYLKLIDA